MLKKILVSICALAAAAAIWSWSAPSVWAYSSYYVYAQYGGTYYDAEKSPTNSDDDLMCWAAAASNVLAWTGWAKNFSSADAIFKYFQDYWTDAGGNPYYAYEWWFYGTSSSTSGSYVNVAGGGGFYTSYNLSSYLMFSSVDWQAITNIKYLLTNNYGVTLSLTSGGSTGHAITCWGYQYDDYGNIVGIYVTDSDDSKSDADASDILAYYAVLYSNGEWYLQNFYGTNTWYITEVLGLKNINSTPEPAGVLLLALGLIGLAGMRRKLNF
jgi:hypothetical protein